MTDFNENHGLSDQVRAIADRLDEAFSASAGMADCRALLPLDMLVMMETLANVADRIEAAQEAVAEAASVRRRLASSRRAGFHVVTSDVLNSGGSAA